MTIPIERAVKISKEIGLSVDNVDLYEDCEIIADLIDDEAVKTIEDERFRALIAEMRRLHSEMRRMNYAAYVSAARDIFSRIPKPENVLKYHELEGICSRLSDEEIKAVGDAATRDALEKVKHAHDGIAAKKAKTMTRIKLK
jgi:hypothetical protein